MPVIRAVCFDGFGTVVEIRDRRRPFQALLAGGSSSGWAAKALTRRTGLSELARDLANSPSEERMAELEADLEAECASTRQRPGMDEVWDTLRRLGLKIGVCSNLASAYEHALLGCLPRVPDALVLSFQAGIMKPQIEIYQLVCERLNLEPGQILFVGDSLEADVLGPRRAGLFAMSIGEFELALAEGLTPDTPGAIAELFEQIAALRKLGPIPLVHTPKQALDSGLAHVNVSIRRKYSRHELLEVLRSPLAVMQGDDAGLKHLLSAFIDESDEALLTRITEGGEITWANLREAALAGLRPGDLKLAWIAGRAVMAGANPFPTSAAVVGAPSDDLAR
ncbi:HAD family hydrolase [Bosea sp. BK604]|uniref:HAD family hydrolase n=1 Tax=Bosea sp. BK604 TaxID=2512180 RepID=UPI0024A61C89|nr:HAD family hydrolase [Bosea sp. BK604]